MSREPGHAATSIITLGLGIGGVVAVSSLSISVLRPLSFPDPSALYGVWETHDGVRRGVAPANYLDWRRSARGVDLAAYDARDVTVQIGDGPATREPVAVVSGNFFQVLGASAEEGRTFDPRLDPTFAESHIVLSSEARDRAFGPAAEAVGRVVRIDEVAHVVVGVARPGLAFPTPDLYGWVRARTEAPGIRSFPGDITTLRDAWYFRVVGRATPGRASDAVAEELNVVAGRLARLYPETNEGAAVALVPLREQVVAGFGTTVEVLGLAVALILAGALFNVTQLTMARGERRSMDVAIRTAIGARRADHLRSALVEGWIMGAVGAASGLLLAHLVPRAALGGARAAIPRSAEVGLTPEQVVLAVILGLASGTLIAVVTYRRTASPLGAGAAGRVVRGQGRVGVHTLVAVQVAVSVAILATTATLATSLGRLGSVDLGFDTGDLTTLRLAMPGASERTHAERLETYRAAAAAAATAPGVRAVALGANAPVEMGAQASVRVLGDPLPGDPPDSGWQPVDPGYFEALGIQLLQGRTLRASDRVGDTDVAVVNQAFVRVVLQGRDALGTRVTMGLDGHDRPLEIVGVVADTKTWGPAEPAGPVLYRPLDQAHRFAASDMFVAIRLASPHDASGAWGPTGDGSPQARIRSAVPGVPIYGETHGRDIVRSFHARQSMLLAIMAAFAFAAASIGLVGVYAVATHAVRRQRRSIGVRMALGATSGRITSEVVGGAMRWAVLGLAPGLVLSWIVGRAVQGMLFETAPTEPPLLAAVSAIVLALTMAALHVPARTAAATDPARVARDG
jgi:predicted permease